MNLPIFKIYSPAKISLLQWRRLWLKTWIYSLYMHYESVIKPNTNEQSLTSYLFNSAHLQMNQQAVSEHAKKMWSLPGDLKEAVNACVGAHFPEYVDEVEDTKSDQNGQYGQVYRGWCPFSYLSLALLITSAGVFGKVWKIILQEHDMFDAHVSCNVPEFLLRHL